MPERRAANTPIREFPLGVAIGSLHRARGHDRKRHAVAEALATGGMSLVCGRSSCTCERDATSMIEGLLDAGFVIVREDER